MARGRVRTVVAVVAVAVLVSACSADGADEADGAAAPGSSTTTLASSTVSGEAPVFDGDPDSRFCELSRAAADRPVLNPFEAGLAPREVELRFRALASRFRSFEDVAPEALAADLDQLVATFDEFARLLDAADYDFARLAEQDVDLSTFDDPALERVAERLAAYQDQVCRQP